MFAVGTQCVPQTVPFGVCMALSWKPLSRDRWRKTPPGREPPLADAQQKSLSWGKFYGHREGGEPVPQMEQPKDAPYSTASPHVFPSLHLASPRSWKLALRHLRLCKRPLLPRLTLKCPPRLREAGGRALPAGAGGMLVPPVCFPPGHPSVGRSASTPG